MWGDHLKTFSPFMVKSYAWCYWMVEHVKLRVYCLRTWTRAWQYVGPFKKHFFCCRLFILGVNENSNSTSTTDLQWDRVSDTSHWHQEQSSQWETFDQSESGQATNQPIRNHQSRSVASVWVISSISGIKSKNQWRHAPSWHRHLFPNIWYSMIEWDVWALGLFTVAVLCLLLPYYTWYLILNNILLNTICMKRTYQGEFPTNLWSGCLCLRPGLGSF